MIKAKTVEQYHLIKHIKEHFIENSIDVELVKSNAVRITDKFDNSAILVYKDGNILEQAGRVLNWRSS